MGRVTAARTDAAFDASSPGSSAVNPRVFDWLFGFHEYGYRTVIDIAVATEVAATLILTPVAAVGLVRAGYAASRSAWDLEAK